MSTLANLKVEDLGLTFAEFEGDEMLGAQFGPSKKVLKSYHGWEGCDNKFFHPFNSSEKVSKLSDFVSAAIQEAREKEREMEKKAEETQKKPTDKKYAPKATKVKEESKTIKEENSAEEDDDGFTTIEDNNLKSKAKPLTW